MPVKGDLEPQVDWKVYKSGVTTAITMGYVKGISETMSNNGRIYYNQVQTTLSCNGGDSGSPVWYLDANINRQIVGILASKATVGGMDYCYFSNIRYVKSDLGVTVLTR
ncbi:MAG: hypothetical protein FIB08_07715 [Candidatus Methanoperedens sp.]|nr:hypothetical protein [Candidatus Methanoperedens sp.]